MASTQSPTKLKELIYISVLIAVGIVLNLVEPPVFTSIPGPKLGLANIATLLALLLFGNGEAIIVASIRPILSSFFKGALHPIPFFTSVVGSITAATIMIIFYNLFKKQFSIVGISIIGGITNNLAQFFVVLYITRNTAFWYYLPVLLLLGGVSGWIIGLIVKILYNRMGVVIKNGQP